MAYLLVDIENMPMGLLFTYQIISNNNSDQHELSEPIHGFKFFFLTNR